MFPVEHRVYGKVFSEIFDSSLMAEGGWLPTYVFMCMISMADKNGHIRQDPRTLYRRLGLSIDERVSFNEFMDAIEYLQTEDEFSNIMESDGRRIIAAAETDEIDGNRGWLIVNYVHYRDKGGSLERRRANDAARKRKQRERKNSGLEDETPKCHVTVTGDHVTSAHTDTDTDTDSLPSVERARKRATRLPEDFELNDERRAVAEAEQVPAERTFAKFCDYWRGIGGQRGRKLDWDATWRNWCRTEADRSRGNQAPRKSRYDELMDQMDG